MADRPSGGLALMQVYKPSGGDSSVYVAICGPPPVHIGKETIHAEYGRAIFYPACIRTETAFFNGQMTDRSATSIKHIYMALEKATAVVLAIYTYPFIPYLEAAILLYHMACTTSARMTVVNPSPINPAHYPQNTAAIDNIPGSPYAAMTLRDRIVEVSAIICTAVGWHERCGGIVWQWQNADQSLDGKFEEARTHMTTKRVGHYISQHNIPIIQADLFDGMKSDIATVLRSVFQVAAIRPGLKGEKAELESATVFGNARGIILGFISAKLVGSNMAANQHREELLPVILFLNQMLVAHGSEIRFDLLTP
jgi:hypothetical protein